MFLYMYVGLTENVTIDLTTLIIQDTEGGK